MTGCYGYSIYILVLTVTSNICKCDIIEYSVDLLIL